METSRQTIKSFKNILVTK